MRRAEVHATERTAPVRHVRNRTGISATEILVVIVIIAILLALLLPAVQQARESARRVQCQSHLKQLGLAVYNYESTHGVVPASLTMGYSWLAQILPYIERSDLYRQIDFTKLLFADLNHSLMGEVVPLFRCPSDGAPAVSRARTSGNNYAGNAGTGLMEHGYNGVFQPAVPDPGDRWNAGPVRWRDVTDGLSGTAMASEFLKGDRSSDLLRVIWFLREPRDTLKDLRSACVAETPRFRSDGSPFGSAWSRGHCWLDGNLGVATYTHILGPQSPSCFDGSSPLTGNFATTSNHAGGVHLLSADGHVRFVSQTIDENVWIALGSRNGDESVSSPR